MKSKIILFGAIALLMLQSSCKKENSQEAPASIIAGTYVGTYSDFNTNQIGLAATASVSKVSDNELIVRVFSDANQFPEFNLKQEVVSERDSSGYKRYGLTSGGCHHDENKQLIFYISSGPGKHFEGKKQ